MRPENELLEGARIFDPDILAEIFDSYSPGLFRYAYRLLGDEQMAQDCVAETFSRFLKTLRGGGCPSKYLQAYLYRIAHNWVSDVYRRQPPPALEISEDIPDASRGRLDVPMEERLEREQVGAALYRLPPDQRQVIVLKFIEGWEIGQIAAALQKPPGTIRVIQHRAIKALHSLLLGEESKGPYVNE